MKETRASMQWKRRRVKRDYYHIIIKFPLKNISLQIEARSSFLWLNPSILNWKSENIYSWLEKRIVVGCWNMMCDECSVQRLCWISKKLWSLCWLSGQSWSGHLIMKWKRKVTWFKQKSVERLLSWILSKEKFMPHDIKSIYILFRWTRIQTPWNWSFSALEWPTTFPLFLPLIDWWDHFRKLTQNAPFWSPPRPPSLHLCWLRTLKEIHSHTRKL